MLREFIRPYPGLHRLKLAPLSRKMSRLRKRVAIFLEADCVRSKLLTMKKTLCVALPFILLQLAFPRPGYTQTSLSLTTGTKLLAYCRGAIRLYDSAGDKAASAKITKQQEENSWRCLGYVQGVVDTEDEWTRHVDVQTGIPAFCLPVEVQLLPPDVKYEQFIRIVVKYIENNPEDMNRRAVPLIHNAMIGAFYCGAP